MTRQTMEAIVRAAGVLGLEEEVSAYEGYSGRGMYGKTTCGVTADREAHLLACVAHAASEMGETPEADSFVEDLMRLTSDSLGTGRIYY